MKQVHAILPKYELKSSSTATLLYPIENSAKSTNSKDIDLSSNDKSLVGFELHSVIKNMYGGDLKATVVTFQSDSPEQIHEWFHIIEKIMRKRNIIENSLRQTAKCRTYFSKTDA